MSVESMTELSYLLFVISGGFAVLSAVLFFALNIPKCLRIVSGRRPVHNTYKYNVNKKKQQIPARINMKAKTEKLDRLEVYGGSEATLPLQGVDRTIVRESAEETLLLQDMKQTEIIDTKNLDMIQDIVYMQGTGNVD